MTVNTKVEEGVPGTIHKEGNYFVVLFNSTTKEYAVLTLDAKSLIFTEGGEIEIIAGEFYGTAVVPEPTILALLALGIAGVALRRRAQ